MRCATAKASGCQGFALTVALFVLALATLLGLQTYRTAVAEARLIRTLLAQQTAADLAQAGTARGLAVVGQNMARLPAPGTSSTLPTLNVPAGRTDTTVAMLGSDTSCPALASGNVIREHYELRATAVISGTAQAAATTHAQGFYVCRELCAAPCTAVTVAPVRTYWADVPR